MIRSVLAVAIVTAIAIGVSAAMAQQDPIKARKDLMKVNGDQAKIGAAMVKGDRPFDLAAVHKIFATFEDAAVKMPAVFPDSSKSEANSPEADECSLHDRLSRGDEEAKPLHSLASDLIRGESRRPYL
jgi:cytochrome c556